LSYLKIRAFEFPCREALRVDMVGAAPVAAIIAIPAELKLEFHLVLPRRLTANRAASAYTRPSPHALWEAAG
jgi:leucyl aminopeptidase